MKPDRETRTLLKALAGKGACLELQAGRGVAWQLIRTPGAKPEPKDSRLIRKLRSEGLIDVDREGRAVISAIGRQALRRWLSHGDGFQDQHRVLGIERRTDVPKAEALQVNLAESPLAWLASRKDKNGNSMLDTAQVRAGERLRSDYDFACLMPTCGPGWRLGEECGSTRHGSARGDLSDDVIAARQRLEKTLAALEPALATVVVDVCCHLKGLKTVEVERGWPPRSAKVVLQIGLSSLARRYGYAAVSGPETGPIRSWSG